MNCEDALLKPPPRDLGAQKLDYAIFPRYMKDEEKKLPFTANPEIQPKRLAFMLCALTFRVNEALIFLKRQACGDRGNFNQNFTVYDDPGPH